MTKLLVFSDIHGNTHNLMRLIPHLEKCDAAVFLGDGVASLEILPRKVHKNLFVVKGNCDFFCPFPDEQVVDIGGVKVLLAHGNTYGVKNSAEPIKRRLVDCGASLGLYGHTHTYNKEEFTVEGVKYWLINVGSLGTSRTPNGGTYVEIIIDNGAVKEIKNCIL